MCLGILSRKLNTIPLCIGDILYAVMFYFGIRILFININPTKKIIVPLLLCYTIELQQLYNAHWIVIIRDTVLGHYLLGEGFLWSDLFYYTFGVTIAYFIDAFVLKKGLKPKSL